MSYKKKEEQEMVSMMQRDFKTKQQERIAVREAIRKKHNTFFNRIFYWIYS